MKPTYEELEARNKELEARCDRLEELLKKALDRIADLEEQLNRNSNNSSKPPSTDKKANTRPPKVRLRKPRKGSARALLPLDQIDRHEVCEIDDCPHCGSAELRSKGDPVIFQQVDLPEVKGVVTQYDLHSYQCQTCKSNIIAPRPEGVPNSAFGPRLMALVANLTGVFHLSKADAKQLVADLFAVDISDGSVINIEERVSQALNPVCRRIHTFVTESGFCKHFDETSWRDSGKTHYVWVAATKQAVCYRIDRHRSRGAFEAIAGQLHKLAPVVTDRYSAYNSLENPRQFCIPHLIRNFRRFSQRDGPDGKIGSAIEKELQFLSHTHGLYRKAEISRTTYSQRVRRCRDRVDGLFMDALIEASEDLGTLCEKLLLDEFENLWTFHAYRDAEPSNNLAERDLRKIVLWRKKSYGTRSERGQVFVQTISSVAGTLRRSGANILSFLTEAVVKFYQGLDAPMIQPSYGF
ncbi:MAG: IS66 family transposase [Paracoccaceae bacterium]